MTELTYPLTLKRRPFPVRLWRSYRAFRDFMGRRDALRGAWFVSTCGTNFDAINYAVHLIGCALGVVSVGLNVLTMVLAGLLRGAIALIRSPSASFVFCGVSLSTALDAFVCGKPLVGAIWLAGAALCGSCGYRDARKARAARDRDAYDAGVRAGRDYEATITKPGGFVDTIARLAADATNQHFIGKGK